MKKLTRSISRPRIHLVFIEGALVALLFQSTIVAGGQCYRTPQAAVDGVQFGVPLRSEEGGYQLTRIVDDQLLGLRWAVLASCGHPEWPAFTLPVFDPPSTVTSAPRMRSVPARVLVRAGNPVRLWRREALVQIEVAAVSEQNGTLGDTVRVRLLHANSDEFNAPRELSGIVEGPSDVEMKP